MSKWARPAFSTVTSAEHDEDRIKFFKNLYRFFKLTKSEGITKDGHLHSEVEAFDKKYRIAIPQTVQFCVEKMEKETGLQIVGQLLSLCLEFLIPRVENFGEYERSQPEKTVDELFARTLVGILSVLTRSTTKRETATGILPEAYSQLTRYVMAVKHQCTFPGECRCFDGNPMDHMVETVTLATAAKHTPKLFLSSFNVLATHYASIISVKWIMAVGLMYSEYGERKAETQVDGVVIGFNACLDSGGSSDVSSAVIIPSGGEPVMTVQRQTSDFLILALDFLRNVANKSPKRLSKAAVDAVERPMFEKMPEIVKLTIGILKILSENNPTSLTGRGRGYIRATRDMQLPLTQFQEIAVILVNCTEKNNNDHQVIFDEMGQELEASETKISAAILSAWENVVSANGLNALKKWKPTIEKLQDIKECREQAIKILNKLEIYLAGTAARAHPSASTTESKSCVIL